MNKRIAQFNPWHHHHPDRFAFVAGGVGYYEMCRCGKSRQCCGDRWRRRQPAGQLTVRGAL